jgi:cell shape-determining protein MreC
VRKENWFLGILAVIALFLLFWYPSLGWKFRTFISGGQNSQANEAILKIENTALKASLAEFRMAKAALPQYSGTLIPAFTYSEYPFNFKNEILISIGSDHNIREGQAVVIGSSASSSEIILVGKIRNVIDDAAIVETVFDSRFQASVRIGESGIKALLKGGTTPKVTLVPKDAKVQEGDAIYSVDPGFPFGVPIGEVKNIRLSADQLFQEADADTPYSPSELTAVFIVQK